MTNEEIQLEAALGWCRARNVEYVSHTCKDGTLDIKAVSPHPLNFIAVECTVGTGEPGQVNPDDSNHRDEDQENGDT